MVKKLLLVLLFVAPLSLIAQEKYAYVNSQEVMNKMPEMGEMEKKIVSTREAILKTKQELEAEYQQKADKFQKDTANVSESILQSRYQELEQLEERYKLFMTNSETELRKVQQTLFTPIQQKLQKAIKEVGDEKGYTYIFDTNTLIYKNPKLTDATKSVKAKLGIID